MRLPSFSAPPAAGDLAAGGLLPERAAGWRQYALALLPLALAGLLPWWATGLLCGVFALGVRSEAWREGRFMLSLLVGGLAILPGIAAVFGGGGVTQEAFWPLLFRYLAMLLGVGGLYWASVRLEEGQRRGLLVLALLGLLAPQPLLLLALAGGALCRESPDDRVGVTRLVSPAEQAARRSFLVWTAAGVLGLAALAAFLPRYVPTMPTAAVSSSKQAETAPVQAKPPDPQPVSTTPSSQVSKLGWRWAENVRIPAPPLELGLTALLLLTGALLWKLLQLKPEGERKKVQWLQLLMLAGLMLNGLILFFLAMMQSRGGGDGDAAAAQEPGGAGGAQATQTTFERVLDIPLDLFNLVGWLGFVGQLLLVAVAGWLLWRLRVPPPEPPASQEALDIQPDHAPDVPHHRVRAAYLHTEEALRASGWGRSRAETPAGYAARLSREQPVFGPALTLLTRLYNPVRYGGRVSEEEAEQAEVAAQELAGLAAQHPFHRDSELKAEHLLPGEQT